MSYIETDLNPIRPVFRFRCRMAGKGPEVKNLFGGNFIAEDCELQSDDTIKVVLRLKPSQNDTENVIQVLDSKTILYKMPSDLSVSRKKLNIPDECKYTFSNIFQPNVTQSELYNGCVASLVKDLFAGQHCLLFTYGTTNAGKTFTVLGTGDHPGIIPRTLTTVFKSIKGKEYGDPRIRPHMFNSALEVNDETFLEEADFKRSILNWNPDKTQSDSSRLCKTYTTVASSVDDMIGESVFQEMQKRLTNDTSIVEYEAEAEDRFSVWVSFAEIYNENIFDLLQPVAPQQRRTALKLSRDTRSNTYIKGLKHVFVQSEDEAYKVLRFGKNNLQVAATSMNTQSSRSHCIFAIKLIKYPNVENPESVVVSSFSICDLAGAERQKKTLNVGIRLKESQNINCSLHVLSRCFSIIRENQVNNENKLIPFRDSKLTQLFQHALQGKENVTMIVNVNPERHLCEETQHVLKATAVAKQIVVARPRAAYRPLRSSRKSTFSQIITKHNRSTLIRWDSCVKPSAPDAHAFTINSDAIVLADAPSELEKKQDDYEKLLALVETLKDKLETEKAKHIQTKKTARQREDEIREEMKAELFSMLEEAKKPIKIDIKKAVNNVEANGDKREERLILGEPLLSKRPKKDRYTEEDDVLEELADLQEQVNEQKLQIDMLTNLANMKGEENKELTMNLTSLKMQLAWKDREIGNLNKKVEIFGEEGDLKAAYVELEKEMKSKLQIMDNLLEEARADMLEGISAQEDLEIEIAKLEKEIASKESENWELKSHMADMKIEIDSKTETLSMLENHIEEIEEKFDDDIKELERKLSQLEIELKEKNEELKKFNELSGESQQIDLVKSELEKLVLEKKSVEEELMKQSEEFKRYKEDMSLKMEHLESEKQLQNQIDNDHSSEVSTLEKEVKQQIQESARLAIVVQEKSKEVKDLTQMYNKVKADYEELRRALQMKEHDLECRRSEIIGYQNSLPALKTEMDTQRKELLQMKRRCEDHMEVIFNMEKEKESFKSNQVEIIGKYEDQLKKTKEENEALKREVARVTTAFYKSTPTSKINHEKLQEKYDELTKQLEDLQIEYNKIQEKESHPAKHGSRTCGKLRPTELFNQEDSKVRPLRPRTPAGPKTTAAHNTDISYFDSEKSQNENSGKPVRKPLLNTACSFENIQFEDEDEEADDLYKDSPNKHKDFPRKSKRILRARNK